jgi:tRNA A37 threonylcarbamoyladenosine dehydratase
VASKILIIENAGKAKTPVISCMGTRNKMDPQRFAVGDISKAGSSGAAKTIREELRKKGINKVKVLYSKERPVRRPGKKEAAMGMGREMAMGSIAYIPGVAGLYIAGEVIRDLLDGSGLKK